MAGPAPQRALTLLVPGLLWPGPGNGLPHPAADLTLPHLLRLLRRSDSVPGPTGEVDQALFELFGVDTGMDLPIAPLTLALDAGHPPEGYCLRADPVHLRADRDRLVLLDHRFLHVSREEAEALTATVNDHFAHLGWHLAPHAPERWYLRLPEPPALRTTPLAQVLGRDVLAHLPSGPEGPAWRGHLNELQMLLHAHPVNARREATGRPTVNSVWVWGGGQRPSPPPAVFAQVWSGDPLALGLADLAGTPRASLPAGGREWLDRAVTPGRHLICLDDLPALLTFGELEAWREGLLTLERDWLAPLAAALRDGTLGSLTLYPSDGQGFIATGRSLRRWWRRDRPLGAYYPS